MTRPTARRFSLRRRRGMAVAILFAILIAIRIWQDRQNPPTPETLAEGAYEVERVVDGDTLLLANGARVRLIGADAPETVKPESPIEPFGPEAAELSRRFIAEAGNVVQLQFDRERIDRYGRFLAYVWVGDRMLNEELIRAGLATAETRFRYAEAMKTRFRRAEDEAKAAGRGIWSREPARGAAGFPGTARFALFASPGRPRRLATTG